YNCQLICRSYGTDACSRENGDPRVCGVSFLPDGKRGICGYTGCHEDARHHYSPQSHEDAGIPGGSSDDVDCQNRRRTVCGGSHARAWSAAETDKYLQNWLWAFGHFLLPAGDTVLGRFLYLLGGRSL